MKKAKKYIHPIISQVDELSTKLIALNKELDDKNKQLRASELARERMFTNISHDLRAPISIILGAIERLHNGKLGTEEQHHMLGIIESRAKTLDQLIEDLYLSTLVNQPEFSVHATSLDIAPVLEEYYISVECSGRLDNRAGRLSIPDGFAAKVSIDAKYFPRVLDNLMSNALKHTSDGDMIELGCRADDGFVEIYLKDSGVGIAESDMARIFDRTFTGAAARTPGKTGSGLGLSIAQDIVKKHHGHIRCASALGKGSVFTVSLPRVFG